MAAKTFTERLMEAASDALAWKPAGPTLNGRAIFAPEPYEGEQGMCVACKEWCDVGSSCCGRGVIFEGGFVADVEEESE